MKILELYQCEICGRKSTDRTAIETCESQGRASYQFQVGDKARWNFSGHPKFPEDFLLVTVNEIEESDPHIENYYVVPIPEPFHPKYGAFLPGQTQLVPGIQLYPPNGPIVPKRDVGREEALRYTKQVLSRT